MQVKHWRNIPLSRAGLVLLLVGGWIAAASPVTLGAENVQRPADWTDATHSNNAKPNYERLFSLDRVHELRIVMSPENYEQVREDLNAIAVPMPVGIPVSGGPAGAPGGLAMPGIEACKGKDTATGCSVGGREGTCSRMPDGMLICVPNVSGDMAPAEAPKLRKRDPIHVPVSVHHDGRTWNKVGMRYKGNLSLRDANMEGNGKISFRLDFDHYAESAPETKGQRFYGFEKLIFSANPNDDSQIREALAGEIFRAGGVPAPRSSFYRVFVDVGNGPQYWGLYTLVEDPADGAMLDAQLGGKGGNLYKPDGPGADWTKFNAEGFEKKTNKKRADFSDVSRAIEALHAPRTNAAEWRANLEASFDVEIFLKWLAINTAIENWDAYGFMAHNYYLYAAPSLKGRLCWIPWDIHMAFGGLPGFWLDKPGIGRGFPPMPPGSPDGGSPANGRDGARVPGRPDFGSPMNPRDGARAPGRPDFGSPANPRDGVRAAGRPDFGGPANARDGARAARGFPPAGGPGEGFPNTPSGVPALAAATEVLHKQVTDRWPLIQLLLSDEKYVYRYRTYLEQAVGTLLAPDTIGRDARRLHALVRPAIVGPMGERPSHTTVTSPEAFESAIEGPSGLLQSIERRREQVKTALSRNGRP